MGENMPCIKHEEQIKTLYEKDKAINKRVDSMGSLSDVVYNLDKNMALQTQMMQQMSERNDRQDKRMDEQDARMSEYQGVMVKVSTNLTELAEGQRLLNQSYKDLGNEVKDLKQKVEESEEKNLIDLRDINKQKHIETLFRYALPTGGAIIILLELLKAWKG